MKNKLKKQKRLLLIRIISVLLAAFLVISAAYCGAILHLNKTELVTAATEKGDMLIDAATNNFIGYSFSLPTYDIKASKAPYWYSDPDQNSTSKSENNYPLMYDKNVHIVFSEIDISQTPPTQEALFDSDRDVNLQFTALQKESTNYLPMGYMNAESFISSIPKEDYDTIREYLLKGINNDGDYYELLCTQFYSDEDPYADDAANRIVPKRIELVLSNKKHVWYAEDEVILICELEPQDIEGLELYTTGADRRNVIPDQVVLNNFGSGGLLENTLEKINFTDPYSYYGYGSSDTEKAGTFKYIYSRIDVIALAEPLSGSSDTIVSSSDQNVIYYYSNAVPSNKFVAVCYAESFDVLSYSMKTLIIGVGIILLFFLTVGIILTTLLWKVLKTQMQEAEKRREITNALAHDIKTPLFIIEGFAQNLKENVHTEKRDHYADRIIERTQEANSIIHKMLDFAHIESDSFELQREDININELTQNIVADLAHLANSRRIRFNASAECSIKADRECIQRVITNLVDNALKYSDEDTDISIETTADSFCISNTCSGLTKKDTKHFTDAYFRMDKERRTEGSGLGLTTVETILKAHGYKLTIDTENSIVYIKIHFGKSK